MKEEKKMKNYSHFAIIGIGILLSIAGCQKGTDYSDDTDSQRLVQFGAQAGAPSVRTEYSGVVVDGWERINWTEGDQILVWSDNAINRDNRPGKSAVYDILNIREQGKESHASMNRSGEDGLVFLKTPSDYKFWGMYPSNAYKTMPTAGEVSFDIPATQTSSDMTKAVQLAYASIPEEQHVDLHFKPAYTAFSFTVAAAVDMQINGFTMTSIARENGGKTFGPSVMNGTVAAKVEGSEWKYTVPEVAEGNTSISTSFSTPLELTKAVGAEKTNEVTFMLFAVPADITSLTMQFNVTVNGKAETRKLSVSYAKDGTTSDGTTYVKGDPITFKALKKHNIKGIVLPKSVNHDVVLDFQVMPWEDSEGNMTYGPDAIANAVALEFASGAAITTGGSRRRNNNFADETNPIHAYFSVFAPQGGTWKITATGATEKILLQAWNDDDAEPTTELTGTVAGRVDFLIVRKTDATVNPTDQIQINFSVVTAGGQEININSEVTRASALTITGKIGQ